MNDLYGTSAYRGPMGDYGQYSTAMGSVMPAGDPRLPGGFWSSSKSAGTGGYGAIPTSAPVGGPISGSGGYTYLRLQNGMIAILRGAAPSGSTLVNVRGYSAALPAVLVGTAAWVAIDQQMRGVAPAPAPAAVQEAVNTDAPAAAGGLFASLLSTLGQGDKQKGAAVVASAAAQYGPGIVAGLASAVQSRGQSLPDLERKIAAKMQDYVRAKAQGNTAKATKLAYEIKALQGAADNARAVGLAAVPDYPAAPPQLQATGMSWWPLAALAGGALLIGGALALNRSR